MRKKLDALFTRKFNTSKFSSLAKLAISRIAILKNRKQVRVSFAKSDVIQLLNLGYQERALLRVEHVIKDQGMADAFDMMEDYIHFLVDRVVQLQKNKECPDELKEAVSSLIFASSRCGECPELQEIRGIFTSRFGKEFAAGAVELRSNCGVNSYIIENLSGRQPSLESRKKLLKGIATENGIILNLVEDAPVVAQENFHVDHHQQQQQQQQHHHHHHQQPNFFREEELSGSSRGRKYKDVASAALDAFEAAVYAAQAARVAVELSRYESLKNEQHGYGDSSHG
uniref:IST1-like protein n=1 Tax=Salix viminalis TaxID=40686 RepID=A0A6N2KVH3_SALVM